MNPKVRRAVPYTMLIVVLSVPCVFVKPVSGQQTSAKENRKIDLGRNLEAVVVDVREWKPSEPRWGSIVSLRKTFPQEYEPWTLDRYTTLADYPILTEEGDSRLIQTLVRE